ncbi:hypothetical protein BDN70DRAFT_882129 [Pholiota conissans]|uniref:F-box domain-containing protein n=1 Tax=Pholiota conissans TaxID=109636 RepID=A0A9P6CXV1_9AGAR|nr:hypothetical protein BDN70DRAFT_882129 [Pholiota conissans]
MSSRGAKTTAASKIAATIGSDEENSETYESDNVTSALSDSEGSYGSGGKKGENGEPPAKRAKLSVDATRRKEPATSAKAPLRRGKKSLSLLPNMPLDVLFEILGQLTPKDLLNVSRTNKLFHETLTSKSARTVWKDSLKGQGVPECPSGLTEPRWTSLLFETTCECCGAKNVHKVDFYIRRRVCVKCRRANLLTPNKIKKYFPTYHELLVNMLPFTDGPAGGWAGSRRTAKNYYWHSDVADLALKLGSRFHMITDCMPGAKDELEAFVMQAALLRLEIRTAGPGYQTWFDQAALEKSNENNEAKKNRFEAIRAKFHELGYDPRDTERLEFYKECDQKAVLTDNIWKRVRPNLESMLVQIRDRRIAREIEIVMQARRDRLFERYLDYKATLPSLEWKYLPDLMELGKKEPFKAIVDSKSLDDDEETDFDIPTSKYSEAIAEIHDELKAELVQKLSNAWGPGKTVPSDCLNLATSVFCCRGTCGMRTFVVGTDDILSHNCGSYSPRSYHISGTQIRDFVVHPFSQAIAKSLVCCVGLDPDTTLSSEMDAKDLRFACNACTVESHLGYTWRTALSHWVEYHQYKENPVSDDWRILSPGEVEILKENEERDPKWSRSQWQCSHCPIYLRKDGMWSSLVGELRETVIDHVQTEHEIASPTVPDDLFYFEKVKIQFRYLHHITFIKRDPLPSFSDYLSYF